MFSELMFQVSLAFLRRFLEGNFGIISGRLVQNAVAEKELTKRTVAFGALFSVESQL